MIETFKILNLPKIYKIKQCSDFYLILVRMVITKKINNNKCWHGKVIYSSPMEINKL